MILSMYRISASHDFRCKLIELYIECNIYTEYTIERNNRATDRATECNVFCLNVKQLQLSSRPVLRHLPNARS